MPNKNMEFPKNARTIAAIAGVIVLVAAIYSIPIALKAIEPEICTVDGECQHEIFADNLIKSVPIILLLGIGIGAGAYYFFSERKQQAGAKPQNREAMFRLLDRDERKIFAKIVENHGKALQSELSHLEGIGKVKAHRMIEKMEKKGIVEKEAMGKTNVIKLPKDLQELFSQ
jgi:uncharacterized membrane protein